MKITRIDVLWNYAATFLKIAASALLLPFILRMMSAEMVGIWTVFMTITSFVGLLDFGFNPSFTRNVTYVFSGVQTLKINGFVTVEQENSQVDYGLLKGVISAMRWFYSRMAIVLFVLLITLGTYYIHTILHSYKGNTQEVYIAWAVLCTISTYNLFMLYYDSLLQGKGLIKRSKQIVIAGQSAYLVIATILILSGFGLVAIVSAQASSVIIIRWLAYRSFFTREIRSALQTAKPRPRKEILKAIYPNAVKIGLTSLGGFLVQRSAIIIGSLYLTLEEIASYGITLQLIGVIAAVAGIYTATYQPKIVQWRVKDNLPAIRELYLRGQVILVATFLAGGLALFFFGDWGLRAIGSHTPLMPRYVLLLATVVAFLENNHSIAGNILLTKNEVPFLRAALFAGGLTLLLLLVFFRFTSLGLWAMVAAPGIAQALYQNWKWPLVVAKELRITARDVSLAARWVLLLALPTGLRARLTQS
jgi:O-antigen/teichoic acid export membrane protein